MSAPRERGLKIDKPTQFSQLIVRPTSAGLKVRMPRREHWNAFCLACRGLKVEEMGLAVVAVVRPAPAGG
ncbi:hypothetical protein EA543_19595 [Salmonella enterica subsp. enterica serovar Poona]|nr:hypothetical protein [Salmonella enterica subsp. enterica serovar Poona]